MADPTYNDLIGDEGFLEWFWQGTHGNNLIRFLNTHPWEDKIRRERFSPFAYGLIFNGPISDTAENASQFNSKFRLMKVGFTQSSTVSNENNRMEQIIRDFRNHRNVNADNISVLFVLMKSATDTTSHRDFERNIINKLGIPIKNSVARNLNLPVPTEWVLTTQAYVNLLIQHKNSMLSGGRSVDAGILNEFNNFELRRADREKFGHIIDEICDEESR